MASLVLIGVLVAVVLVMASGVWAAIALIGAVWRVERRVEPVPPSSGRDTGKTSLMNSDEQDR